jgi:hypothetical protein
MNKHPARTTVIAIAAAASVAVIGLLVRALAPELIRYARMRRM